MPRKSRKDMKVIVTYDKPIPAPIKQGDAGRQGHDHRARRAADRVAAVCRRQRRPHRDLRPHGDGRGPSDLGQPALTTHSSRPLHHRRRRGGGRANRPRSGLLVAALERAGHRRAAHSRARRLARRRGDPRSCCSSGDNERWDAVSEALLLYAARRDHVATADRSRRWRRRRGWSATALPIRPWPIKATAAACRSPTSRRCSASTLGDFAPDLTLILDLPVENGLARAAARAGVSGSVRAARPRASTSGCATDFCQIAARRAGRCAVIDAAGDVADGASRHRSRRSRDRLGVARSHERRIDAPRAARQSRPRRPRGGGSANCGGCSRPAGCRTRCCSAVRAASARRRWRFVSRASCCRQPARGGLFGGDDDGAGDGLWTDPESGVFRRVAAGGHADLLTVERAYDPAPQAAAQRDRRRRHAARSAPFCG